ncbi:MAG: CPBP family intramembrane glutamic endopeptidase [Pirellulales bacterium]
MPHDPPRPRHIVMVSLVFEGALGVLALGLGWLLNCPPFAQVDWNAAAAGLGILASLPPLLVFLLCHHFPVGPFRQMKQIVDEMLLPLFEECSLLNLALISLVAGLGEELFFRGVIQDGMAARVGVWPAIAVAAVLFGLAHPITTTYAVVAGLIGVYLGWIRVESDNLLVPIVAHAAYDFLALAYLVKIRRRQPGGEQPA